MVIRQVIIDDLDQLSILFAEYRVFYEQAFEPDDAKQFLQERLSREESIIFIAVENEQQAGFTQTLSFFLISRYEKNMDP